MRAWRVDALWAVGSAAAVLFAVRILAPPGEAKAAPLFAVLAMLVALGIRRWPAPVLVVLALIVATGLKLLQGPAIPCLLVMLGAVAYRQGWRVTAGGWAVTYVALSLAQIGFDRFFSSAPLRGLATMGLSAAPVAFGRYLRGVRSAAEVARERVAEAEAWRHVENRAARLTERSRLAHDLHDIVAHHVGAMTLRASSGRLALDTSGDTAVAAAALGDIAETGRHVLDELRGLLAVLRDPEGVDEDALVTEPKAAITDAVARVRGAGLPVTVHLDPGLAATSLLVRTTAARVVQEALTNVLKHAGPGTATRLTLSFEAPHTLRLRVDNDPPAAPSNLPASGHGLAGMRDRVSLLGGVLTAGPTAGGGWSIVVALPAPPALPVEEDPA